MGVPIVINHEVADESAQPLPVECLPLNIATEEGPHHDRREDDLEHLEDIHLLFVTGMLLLELSEFLIDDTADVRYDGLQEVKVEGVGNHLSFAPPTITLSEDHVLAEDSLQTHHEGFVLYISGYLHIEECLNQIQVDEADHRLAENRRNHQVVTLQPILTVVGGITVFLLTTFGMFHPGRPEDSEGFDFDPISCLFEPILELLQLLLE